MFSIWKQVMILSPFVFLKIGILVGWLDYLQYSTNDYDFYRKDSVIKRRVFLSILNNI